MCEDSVIRSLLQDNCSLSLLLERFGLDRVKGKAAQLGLKLDSEQSVKAALQALATDDMILAENLKDAADDAIGVKVSVGDDDIVAGPDEEKG